MQQRSKNHATLEKKLGVSFSNSDLLEEALTHRSYLNENPGWPFAHNERLEYLGDAALELAVTEALFERFPNDDEGMLTSIRAALVNYQMIGTVAQELNLGTHLYLSRGESRDTGKAREVILANAMEAVIGAVYLDRGYDATKQVIAAWVLKHLDEVLEKGLYRDPKSTLQELVQEKHRVTPTYRILKQHGPDHQKIFSVGVFIRDEQIAIGNGTSKQEAETNAAEQALKKLKEKKASRAKR